MSPGLSVRPILDRAPIRACSLGEEPVPFATDADAGVQTGAKDAAGQQRQERGRNHAGQHLWDVGRALHRDQEVATAQWVQPRRHQLRHGRENQVLAELARLKVPHGEAGKVVVREQNYFASHAGRMNYRTIHRRGWPIGSGAVESACRQKQCRFKRPGQFWTSKGMRHLSSLTEARHNHHWNELWPTN